MHYTGAGQPVAREGPNLRAIVIAVCDPPRRHRRRRALASSPESRRTVASSRSRARRRDVALSNHILTYPAEVVGAAWDDGIGPPKWSR